MTAQNKGFEQYLPNLRVCVYNVCMATTPTQGDNNMTTTQNTHWSDGIKEILPEYFWAKDAEKKIDWLRSNLGLSLRDAFTVLKKVSAQ